MLFSHIMVLRVLLHPDITEGSTRLISGFCAHALHVFVYVPSDLERRDHTLHYSRWKSFWKETVGGGKGSGGCRVFLGLGKCELLKWAC